MNRLGNLILRTRGALLPRAFGALASLFLASLAQAAALPWTDNQPCEFRVGDGTSPASSQSVGCADAVAIDAAHKKFYVTDRQNHRVLRFAYPATSDKPIAEAVFGQADFTSGAANRGNATPSAYTMSTPYGLAVAANGDLWVSDNTNNRILKFAAAYSASGDTAAGRVLGQPDFTSRFVACANNRLQTPGGLSIDASDNLWVADTGNNRVVRFASVSTAANGTAATQVLGQSNFNSNSSSTGTTPNRFNFPYAVCATGTVLWVADSQNHRVLRFNNATSKALDASADGVLGQANLNSGIANRGGSVAPNTLNFPGGVTADDSGTLIVADSFTNRVLIFANAASLTDGSAATNLLNNLSTAWNIAYDSTYHRLLIGLAGGYAVLQYSNGHPTATALTSTPNPSFPGNPATFTATVTTTGGAAPTGTVQFTENAAVLGTGTLDTAGRTTFSTAFADGSHTIIARYLGDPTHQCSSSPWYYHSVSRIVPTITIASPSNPAKQGLPLTYGITVTPPTGVTSVPTGTITINLDGTDQPAITLDSTAKANWGANALTVGPHQITVSYSGNATFTSVGTSMTQFIDPAAVTTVMVTANVERDVKGAEVVVITGAEYGGVIYPGMYDGYTAWAAYQFSLTSIPSSFESVKLKVHVADTSSAPGTTAIELHASEDDNWSDLTIPPATSPTAPTSIIATPLDSRGADTITAGEWLIIDVTDFIRTQATGDKKATFVFTAPTAPDNWYVGFSTKEDFLNVPVLEFTEASYTSWAAASFSAAELANPAISGPAADPDGTGISNLMRYALDLSARGPVISPVSVIFAAASPATATVTFPIRAAAGGLSYEVQSSTDLATWTTTETYAANGTKRTEIANVVAPVGAKRFFLRLRVTQLP